MKRERSVRRHPLALLLLGVLFAAGCGAAAPPKPTPAAAPAPVTQPAPAPSPKQAHKVTVGALKLNSSAPVFVGVEKGLFKDEGVELDLKWFDAAQPIAVAVAVGEADVGATGLTAALYNLVTQGQKVLVVADKGRDWPNYHLNAVVVSKQEAGQVRSLRDLKGKKVGITTIGSTFHYQIGNLLEQEGMSLKDVEVVALKSMGGVIEALAANQISAGLLAEPNVSAAVGRGQAEVLVWSGDKLQYQIAAIFYSPKFAARKDAAEAFMRGYLKAQRYYYDAVFGTDAKGGASRDEVIGILAKYTGQQPDVVAKNLTYMDRDARLDTADIQKQIDWYVKAGMVQQKIDAQSLVNTRFLEAALQSLK